MRTLGLDMGEKRIGVAISDALGMTAQGIKTILRSSDAEVLAEIDEAVMEFEVHHIVVGLPLNMDGSEGTQSAAVQRFAEKLRKRFKRRATVALWDERLSTAGAERNLLEADLSRKRRRQVIDKMAAVFILQGYLDAQT